MAEDASLESYLNDHPAIHGAKGTAWCCQLPPEIKQQIEAAFDAGSNRDRSICLWLQANGYAGATAARVGYHRSHYKERRGD